MAKHPSKSKPDGIASGPTSKAAELEVQVEIAASPARVWDVLTNFEAYEEWHPYHTITGVVEKFGRIRTTSYNLKTGELQGRDAGVITRFVKDEALEIVSGSPLFWGAKRWFHLQASPKGTLLSHGTRFLGIGARRAFGRTHKIARLLPYLDALSDSISRRAISRNWRKTAGGNRHSRRASTAKARRGCQLDTTEQ